MMNPLVDSSSGRLSAALLLTKNKGRDTISQNPKMPNNPSVRRKKEDAIVEALKHFKMV